jgi:hypothetical protein
MAYRLLLTYESSILLYVVGQNFFTLTKIEYDRILLLPSKNPSNEGTFFNVINKIIFI